jgi:predicted LPLAT superfamily acyltransferase
MSATEPAWLKQKERGSLFLLRVMCWLCLALGRRVSRTVVYGIALYFLLAAPAARKASNTYLARCLARPVTWADIYRHILSFASTIHDRFYLLNDRHELFDIQVFGTEPAQAILDCKSGLFLFGAHFGSFEMLRFLARDKLKVCIAMYAENAGQLNGALSAINPKVMQDIVALGQLDSMLCIHRKLVEGAVVGILADRAVGTDQYLSVPFLGAPAYFPTGPFRMALMLKHPVYFMAGVYKGGNRYEVHFELLADLSKAVSGSREDAIRAVLTSYVATLERHCKAAPFNWFNFYDFWEAP